MSGTSCRFRVSLKLEESIQTGFPVWRNRFQIAATQAGGGGGFKTTTTSKEFEGVSDRGTADHADRSSLIFKGVASKNEREKEGESPNFAMTNESLCLSGNFPLGRGSTSIYQQPLFFSFPFFLPPSAGTRDLKDFLTGQVSESRWRTNGITRREESLPPPSRRRFPPASTPL